jgi:hypothetical protein
MKQIILLLFSSVFLIVIHAQENAPTISGKVKISIIEGTFECDLTMSNIPPIQDYLIRLNAGMNLLHIKSLKPNEFIIIEDKSRNDSTSSGESLAYFFPDNTGKGKFLPDELQFKYVGKFPVVTDTIVNYSRADWRGNIAFNGYSVRAEGVQGAWYPYLYDAKNDVTYECMNYNIEIECIDCSTIYLNGSKPIHAQKSSFKSEKPYELSLFCGNYEYIDDGNLLLLNPTFEKKDISNFSSLVAQYKKFYEEELNIKFSEPPVFVNSTPTAPNFGWLFVSYPTIMGIGYGNLGLGSLFDQKQQNLYKQLIAHELGHYYFGTYKVFNSELGGMMTEGFAEYLSMKLVEELQGKEAYKQLIEEKLEILNTYQTIPISKINSISDIEDRERFNYNYAPLMFVAIEQEIGSKKMWEWLNLILNTKTVYTNYDFLLSTLKKTINKDQVVSKIVENYFSSEQSMQNIKNQLKSN